MMANRLTQFFLLTTLIVFGFSNKVYGQVSGCKDPAATNYNPAATVSDGSCLYNTTYYTPPVKVNPLNNILVETSGLQMAGGFLWSFNDGSGDAAIYRIDTLSNTILQTVNLSGATNIDWEDIAFDGVFFYIGDFGNNATGIRTDLKIYKFPFTAIPDYTTNPIATIASAQIDVINFAYSDQTDFSTATINNTKWDCEAMIVDRDSIHLFTKNWVDINTVHYKINTLSAGTYTVFPVETLPTGYLVTAADKAPGLNIIALLGYQNGIPGNHYMHLLSDYSGGLYFNGNKRRIDLPDATTMGQAEGIVFRTGSYGYISNERVTYGPFTITEKLRSFNTEAFVPAYVLPVNLLKFTVSNQREGQLVNWAFSEPVKNLELLYSGNRTDFAAVQSYATTTEGSFSHQLLATGGCYKLRWRVANGSFQYSNIVCVNSRANNAIDRLVLHANGLLTFNSGVAGRYSFALTSTDGKLLEQIADIPVVQGANTVRLKKQLSASSVVLVKMIGAETQSSVLLSVME